VTLVDDVTAASVAWLERDEAALAGTLARATDVVAVEGQGSWLIDADGRRWLDLASGIAVTNVGHCHPRVVAAAMRQVQSLMHTSIVTHHCRSVELAERLGGLCPFLDDPQVFLCNTGAEAVEGAIKMARRVTGRPGIIGFRGGFHGRTMGATSLTTAKGKYRAGYEPLLGGITIAPYAYPLRHGGDAEATRFALSALDELLELQAPGSTVAAMIVEPVLGEGGYVPPPAAWLHGLRERCDEHGILLVFDEVQCGIGRTGRMFAAERLGVAPDVVLFAKGIASGLPLGGLVAGRALFEQWPTGTHGSTFGGNPVSCAAALATLDVIEDEGLLERAVQLGDWFVARLGAAAASYAGVAEVRGLGLMVGIELVDADMAAGVQKHCLDEGMIVLTCGPRENVLRLIPPLTISDDEAELALAILERALTACC
jgi:4-aminobutyrate aminotransferase